MIPTLKKSVAALVLFLCIFLSADAGASGRKTVLLLPTLNFTGYEIWESKYYPVNVLEQKMNEYLASLLRRDPFTDVRLLDETGAERWFAGERRPGDYAVQMELFSVLAKEREVLGSFEKGDVSLRVRVYDGRSGQMQDSRIASGKDQRYTFNPGDDRQYFLNAREYPVLEILQTNLFNRIHKDGLDLLRLTPPDKGQKMSRPTWKQFSSTSHWQAFKNAIADAADQNLGAGTDEMVPGEAGSGGRQVHRVAVACGVVRDQCGEQGFGSDRRGGGEYQGSGEHDLREVHAVGPQQGECCVHTVDVFVLGGEGRGDADGRQRRCGSPERSGGTAQLSWCGERRRVVGIEREGSDDGADPPVAQGGGGIGRGVESVVDADGGHCSVRPVQRERCCSRPRGVGAVLGDGRCLHVRTPLG